MTRKALLLLAALLAAPFLLPGAAAPRPIDTVVCSIGPGHPELEARRRKVCRATIGLAGAAGGSLIVAGGLLGGYARTGDDRLAIADGFAWATLGAATLYSGYKHWHALDESAGMLALAVGLVVSWVTAILAVKGLVKWLTHHGLIPFGIYRIVLAGVLLAYFWQWR